MAFDRSKWKKNHMKAKKCWGCKWLHVGRKVDHNHCDKPGATREMELYRVHGREPPVVPFHDCYEKQ